ncbi:terminase [Actinomadura sp. CNU-125]|uniref:terminase n=1 Tax=Actinomadura sp. CNU-125 TaxID=1904961 RepID=UPI00095DAFD8|nr:terminase [Actinomadura sp. CNU-125]OLT13013.1 terminase [Actinomadura sp. CNU-125]
MSGSVVSPANRLVTVPQGVPELTLGWEVVGWASTYLRHPNGPRAGQRWAFVESQIRFLLWWYAVDGDGNWLFRHAVRRLAKGSGKSPFAAVLALAEFTAPVRLKDFAPDRPGGCVGKPVDMPLVQIAATAESQTANTMRMVRALAAKGSKLVRDFSLDPGKVKYYKPPEGTLEVITSSSTAAEGAEASFIVADETEHWRPANGGPELVATLEDNLTKSGSRMLQTCNAWKPGIGSVAESSWDAWVAQEEGRTRGESRILYDARIAPPDTDMKDPESLERALKFVYDDCFWQQIRPIMERIWDPQSRPDDSKRKYLNWPTAPEDAWLVPQDWTVLADPKRQVADGEEIVMFFDGSKSRDATALVGCRVEDGHVFTIGIWEPNPSHDSNDVVPVAQVDAAVEQAFDRWQVLAFFADVKEWEGFAKVTWPTRYADKLLIMAVPTGKDPQPIAWDMRSHVYDFTMAAELVEAEIREKAFTHDDDARLTRHVVNLRRHPNRWGVSVSKETPDSPLKIDAGVCMIGARMVRRTLLNSPQWQKRLRRRRSAGKGRVVVLS